MKTLACIALILLLITNVHGQLSSTFYDKSCPRALSIVQAAVTLAVLDQPSHFKRVGASLLRLHFHDCFVNGCDGSILLDDIPHTFTGEKTAVQNKNFLGLAFEVIGTIKDKVEVACSGVVSCADIVAIAARDSVVLLGGPTWTVLLGRRDSTTASLSAANKYLPSPASDLSALIESFQEKGLSTKDLVALSGAHTIGYAHCTNFRDRIYNESNIDPSFATSLKAICPSSGGDNKLTHLDLNTSTKFDNNYYSNLRIKKGLLHSDQQLFNGGSTDSQVTTYSTNQDTFFTDFGAAMVNMGNIEPLTGSSGQIRKYCNKSN